VYRESALRLEHAESAQQQGLHQAEGLAESCAELRAVLEEAQLARDQAAAANTGLREQLQAAEAARRAALSSLELEHAKLMAVRHSGLHIK
jgi:hypothetical protein